MLMITLYAEQKKRHRFIGKFFTTVAAAAKSLQSCPTVCNPIDSSPPGSPLPGILQARTLEWLAISFSTLTTWEVLIYTNRMSNWVIGEVC